MSDLFSKLVTINKYFSFELVVLKLFQGINKYELGKQLPKDFAQQILDNDIILVLSEYTNNDALRNLINLYMLGVEHFKEIQDQSYEYFQIKLNKIILNPVVTSQAPPPSVPQKVIESPVVKKKKPLPFEPPKLEVKIEQPKKEPQKQVYSQTAAVIRDTKAQTFHFTEETITEQINEKISKHHNETVSVDFDNEKMQKCNLQDRVQSLQDERKENMTLDLKQQLFLFDENKEANDLIDQYKNEQEKIDKLKNDQLNEQDAIFLMKLIQRKNKKRNTAQVVSNLSRYNSQPSIMTKSTQNSEQRNLHQIAEDKNESSSKITSSEKNTQKFQFDEQ